MSTASNLESTEPVRGQLTFLVPQPELNYSFSNNDAYLIPRRDGVVVGSNKNGLIDSYDLKVDPAQSYDAVASIARSMTQSRIAQSSIP